MKVNNGLRKIGEQWTPLNIDKDFVALAVMPSGSMYLTGKNTKVGLYHTYDLKSFTRAASAHQGFPETFNNLHPIALPDGNSVSERLLANDNAVYYVDDTENVLIKSTNMYDTQMSIGRPTFYGPVNGKLYMTLETSSYSYKGLWRSDNYGVDWTRIYQQESCKSICITQTGRIILALGEHGIIYSDDNGNTWVQSNITEGYVAKLCITQTGRILCSVKTYGGTNFFAKGIIYSDDNGVTWNLTQAPLSQYYWDKLVVLPGNRVIAIGDIDLWYSDDDGINWSRLNVSDSQCNFVYYSPEQNRLYTYTSIDGLIYSEPLPLIKQINRPITKKEAIALIAECKAYVQSLKQ